MVDVRRALPAAPVAALAGAAATLPLLDGGEVLPPAVAAVAAATATFVVVHGVAAWWPEWARRLVGYLAVMLLALLVAVFLGLLALFAGLCDISIAGCDDDSDTMFALMGIGAVVVPCVLLALYTAVDCRTLSRPSVKGRAPQ